MNIEIGHIPDGAQTEDYHAYSVEILYHYFCYECGRWWSVAELCSIGGKAYCPHCGEYRPILGKNLADELYARKQDS